MQDFLNNHLPPPLSPDHFLNAFDQPMPQNFYLQDSIKNQEKLPDLNLKLEEGTKSSSKNQKTRLAGVKARQKKKMYVTSLEQKVKETASKLQQTQIQLSKCKDQLVQALKNSKNQSNQHTYTFSQLQKHAIDQDPDLDRINFLLDLIQNRIGANGKERQANLDYNFKQIINSMFPAMHRYFMHISQKQLDLFQPGIEPQNLQNQKSWTRQLYLNLKLDIKQINHIEKYKNQFIIKRSSAIDHIKRLKQIKNLFKKQQQIFENTMSDIREDMNPIQSALITIFGEKNKLRKQFSLGQLQQQMDQGYNEPIKKIKIQ